MNLVQENLYEFTRGGDPLTVLNIGMAKMFNETIDNLETEFDGFDYTLTSNIKNFTIDIRLNYNINSSNIQKIRHYLMQNGYMHAKGVDLGYDSYVDEINVHIDLVKFEMEIKHKVYSTSTYCWRSVNDYRFIKNCDHTFNEYVKILADDDIAALLVSILEEIDYSKSVEHIWKRLRKYS